MQQPLIRILFISICSVCSFAGIFGSVQGIVHDPQHRPVAGVTAILRAAASDWQQTASSNGEGIFTFPNVPLGEYSLSVAAPGFAEQQQKVHVASGSAPVLHFALAVAAAKEDVTVTAEAEAVSTTSSTTETTLSRTQLAQTPGADRSNSLAMITDYVPGAYLVHDQLHIRGGHQVSWLIDGIPVPNTNIASNVGPQFDPKDVDYLEVQRGGYAADYGDRTYGVFNVVTRSGFERNNEGEVVLGYGSYNSSDDQISIGSHTNRFAYYVSANGNRSDLGLETPTTRIIRDQNAGLGLFTSLIYNATANDQLRFVGSGRGDGYQIPNSPGDQAAGIRDHERERDALGNFSWVHTQSDGLTITLSPFYHFNLSAFEGGPNDPLIAVDDHSSNYAGGQATLALLKGKHNARFGLYGFGQSDDTLFALTATDGSGLAFRQRQRTDGNLEAAFLEDQYKITSWLTLNAGARFTHFSGGVSENAASPRVGAAVRVPGLNWVLRGFYGRYYQPPPLSTLSGPLLQFALQSTPRFLPLRGERDEQHEVGLAVPLKGWVFDMDAFRTAARNFFDHDVLGNSNIFFPLTIDRVRIRGFETTIRSPQFFHRAGLHLAYSHQSAEGQGGVTGGFTDFSPPPAGFFFLDHDQRNTIAAGITSTLPWKSWASANVNHGSGFLAGNGPFHLPSHTTLDLSLGKSFGENWSVKLDATNVTNNHYMLDASNTFGGTHFVDPLRVEGQLRYRFHY